MPDSGTYSLLGPLIVSDGVRPIEIPSPKQRVLLAALLLRANQIVAVDELAELVWPEGVGAGQATLRSYVMRLRRRLGDLGERVERVETAPPGYRFRLDGAADLDLGRFTGLCRAGGAAARAGEWARAAATLDQALALWRDEPLVDVPCARVWERERPALAEQRRQARESRAEALACSGAPPRPWTNCGH